MFEENNTSHIILNNVGVILTQVILFLIQLTSFDVLLQFSFFYILTICFIMETNHKKDTRKLSYVERFGVLERREIKMKQWGNKIKKSDHKESHS